MNRYKLESIMRMVRDKGRLPTDQWGAILDGDDLLVWFGLDEILSADEKAFVSMELDAMGEAEACMDRLRLKAER